MPTDPPTTEWLRPTPTPAIGTRPGVVVIDCDDCLGAVVGACDGCVVTHLCERAPWEPLLVDDDERRALDVLADADLLPRLRHRPLVGA